MSKLPLSVAIGNYDRARPLFDGTVQIDGVDPVFMQLPPEEIFFRAFRTIDFDICELSMSSFTVKTALGDCPYVGVPAFVSRAFRHNSIYVRKDRIKTPADLKGKRVGLPEYQLTACVWARAILEDDHGVKPSDVIWVRGGIDDPSRPEKITIKLPAGVRLENAPKARPSRSSWRRVRSMPSSRRACRGWRASRTRTSAGCLPIRSRPARTITSAPVSFRSCM